MKADTMNEKTIELPPLPLQGLSSWLRHTAHSYPADAPALVGWAKEVEAILADRASRSRAASEPGEVARLAEGEPDLNEILAIADEESEDSREDGNRLFTREGVAKFALRMYDRGAQSSASEAQAGWVMVPREPTEAMLLAADEATDGADAYRRLLTAAPKPASSPVAAEGQKAVLDEMVDRFLSWKLPPDFSPDCGISFKRVYNEASPFGPQNHEPVGTNLLTADQARAMLEFVIGATPTASMADAAEPIDMVLHCPACGLQHIDAPEADLGPSIDGSGDMPLWANPPHRSHLCHGCGHIWRPADVATNGVAEVKTRGKADSAAPDRGLRIAEKGDAS